MRVVDETLIAEAGRRLAAAAPDSQVILFGSHARGEANPHSDVMKSGSRRVGRPLG